VQALKKFSRFLESPPNRIFVEIVVFSLPFYFLVRPHLNGYTISWILSQVVTPLGSQILKFLVILYAAIANIILFYRDRYLKAEPIKDDSTSRRQLERVFETINREIEEHAESLKDDKFSLTESFVKYQAYRQNIKIVFLCLLDVFISFFKHLEVSANTFHFSFYEYRESKLHFVERLDTSGQEPNCLDIGDRSFCCFKAIETKEFKCYPKATGNYVKGTERRNSVEQFYCIPIKLKDNVLGVINIEIHGKKIFSNKMEMIDFYKSHLLTFSFAIQYQCLKRMFFEILDNKLAGNAHV